MSAYKKLSGYRSLVSGILVLFSAFFIDEKQICAQNTVLSETEKTTFNINGRPDRPVIVPFELINNLIIIEASVNGSVPLKFIVDTGVSNTLISSLPNGEEVFLESSRTVTLSGLGEGEPVEAFYADQNKLNIGRIEGNNVEILFLKTDIFKLSSLMGTYVHGLIGYDLFSQYAVEIDYQNKKLVLYDPVEFEEKFEELPKHRKWFKLPIHIEQKKPYIELDFKHNPGVSYTQIRLLIDSGSSNAFSLYTMTHDSIVVPQSNISTLIGVGLSGNVNGYLGRVQKMKLGSEYIFEQPVVAYPDSFAIRKAFELGDRNGSLGGEVLRRFKIIFHYKGGYILLRKNKDFGDDFNYNLSGIEVNTPVPNLPIYVISDIREGSPAQKDGVQVGDIIKYINGEAAARMNLNDVLNIFQKRQDSRIRLRVQRDSLYKSFRFKLENELKVDPKK
ncbi:aspartyl protease family protein [Gracilimonas sp.]|uniref:aspartyl protease family protein n=1 Tax=Gracilimonas sp. TaxID=1974203 RepID=UPI0032ECAA44